MMRSAHANNVGIGGFGTFVEEKTVVASELQSEVDDTIAEVKSMTKELGQNIKCALRRLLAWECIAHVFAAAPSR